MSNRLEVKIDGNASGFKHAMDTVRTQAKGVAEEVSHSWSGGLLKSLGGGVIAAIGFEGVKSQVEAFLSRAKDIKDISEQLEISTDQTQKWAKAAEEVGASMGSIYSVMTAIQSKRQEALRDPKAADLFKVLGISRDQVLNEDNSKFAQDVLSAGGKDAESRAVLEQIVGRRGLKLISAAGKVDSQAAPISSEAIKAADDMEKAQRKVGEVRDNIVGTAAEVVTNKSKLKGFMALIGAVSTAPGAMGALDTLLGRDTVFRSALKAQVLGAEGTSGQSQMIPGQKTVDEVARELQGKGKEKAKTEDPLVGIKNQSDKEFQLRKEEAELSLHEAERRNMTIAARKKSIKGDLSIMNSEITEREKAQKEGRIFGMTKEQMKQLLPTEIEKQMQTDSLTLTGLKGRAAGFKNDLRQGTNFNFSADSLARVGLFSSSTLSINPMIALSQKQVQVLERIEHNTAHRPIDPHKP